MDRGLLEVGLTMPRLVAPLPPLVQGGPPPPQPGPITGALARIAKYVPVEIVGAFLAIRGVLPAQGEQSALPPWLEIAIYAALVVLTPLYLQKFGGDVSHKAEQIAIATISFAIWSYAIGGTFFWGAIARLAYPAAHPLALDKVVWAPLASALVVLWALAAGLFQPNKPE
jgi:hypothetical protein